MSSRYSASTRLKNLYMNRSNLDSVSLKDFAVDLATNGSKEEKDLVKAWFKNKAGGKE